MTHRPGLALVVAVLLFGVLGCSGGQSAVSLNRIMVTGGPLDDAGAGHATECMPKLGHRHFVGLSDTIENAASSDAQIVDIEPVGLVNAKVPAVWLTRLSARTHTIFGMQYGNRPRPDWRDARLAMAQWGRRVPAQGAVIPPRATGVRAGIIVRIDAGDPTKTSSIDHFEVRYRVNGRPYVAERTLTLVFHPGVACR